MLKFNLDKSVGLSYFEQLKGQLFSAIYCGKIQEGDRLPSLRNLAEDLKVNYKTVRKVYSRLAEEGLVKIVAGSGAFLRKRDGGFTRMRDDAIYKLLGDVYSRSRELGLPDERLIDLLQAYSGRSQLRPLRLAIVDDDEEAHIFSNELELRLGSHAVSVALSEANTSRGLEILGQSDVLLTTSWHMEEVAKLADGLGKKLLEIKPSHEIYTEILSAAQDYNVGIVIRDEKTMHASWEVFMHIYHPSTDKLFWIAPIHRRDLIEKIIQFADLIFVSPMCWDEMRKLTPSDKTLKTYEKFISEETLNDLRRMQILG